MSKKNEESIPQFLNQGDADRFHKMAIDRMVESENLISEAKNNVAKTLQTRSIDKFDKDSPLLDDDMKNTILEAFDVVTYYVFLKQVLWSEANWIKKDSMESAHPDYHFQSLIEDAHLLPCIVAIKENKQFSDYFQNENEQFRTAAAQGFLGLPIFEAIQISESYGTVGINEKLGELRDESERRMSTADIAGTECNLKTLREEILS